MKPRYGIAQPTLGYSDGDFRAAEDLMPPTLLRTFREKYERVASPILRGRSLPPAGRLFTAHSEDTPSDGRPIWRGGDPRSTRPVHGPWSTVTDGLCRQVHRFTALRWSSHLPSRQGFASCDFVHPECGACGHDELIPRTGSVGWASAAGLPCLFLDLQSRFRRPKMPCSIRCSAA